MKKFIKVLIALLVVAALLTSCSPAGGGQKPPAQKTKINIATIMGPTGISMAKLMKDSDEGNALNDYEFLVASSPDQIVGKLTSGEVDIAALPSNLAAALYNKTNGKINLIAINTLGVLYILDGTDSVKSVADLKGKTIYATAQGSSPEFILNYILSKNGIDPQKDITIEYMAQHAELAALMASGDVEIGMLPEPNVTSVLSANESFKIAIDLTSEWKKIAADEGRTDSVLAMSAIVVSTDFLEKNPDAVDAFLKDYENSVNYANQNVDAAADLCEEYGIVPKAAVAKKAIPNCNLVYIAGENMASNIQEYYEVLFEADKASIGGALPDEGFYYTK